MKHSDPQVFAYHLKEHYEIILIDALQEAINDDGFHLQSSTASTSLHIAKSLHVWCTETSNTTIVNEYND